jgi:RNA polymerase sigma-70 factor, ECF subfamily
MGQAATPDRTLNLMFVCAHPAIEPRMRTPLMLQLVLGLDARRMAGAFLIPPGTLGQRLTRARAKIEAARIGFALPDGDDLAPRLGHVLDAIYAAFTVGLDGESEGDAKSTSLAREALWLGSLVAAQLPGEPEAQALLALMLYTQARRPARVDATGCLVPLDAQDTALWDARMLRRPTSPCGSPPGRRRSAATRSRPPSPPPMPTGATAGRPTGRTSPGSTAGSRRSIRRSGR